MSIKRFVTTLRLPCLPRVLTRGAGAPSETGPPARPAALNPPAILDQRELMIEHEDCCKDEEEQSKHRENACDQLFIHGTSLPHTTSYKICTLEWLIL